MPKEKQIVIKIIKCLCSVLKKAIVSHSTVNQGCHPMLKSSIATTPIRVDLYHNMTALLCANTQAAPDVLQHLMFMHFRFVIVLQIQMFTIIHLKMTQHDKQEVFLVLVFKYDKENQIIE